MIRFRKPNKRAASLLMTGIFLVTLLFAGIPASPLQAWDAGGEDNARITADQPAPEYMPLRPDLQGQGLGIRDGSQKPVLAGPDYSPALDASGKLATAQLDAKKNVVIMIQFPNQTFSAAHNNSYFSNLLFGNTYSMNTYYKEQSYNQMWVEGTVLGPYTSAHNIEYYATDSNLLPYYTDDYYTPIYELAREAVQLAEAANPTFPWDQYDNDRNGLIDAVTIIHAGPGQEEGAPANSSIWSHAWAIKGGEAVSGGKTVYEYNMDPETGQLGVFCHEFGHVLGLPDLYDTTYTNAGAGNWELMASGSWNQYYGVAGDCPAGLSAWSRHYLGWLDYTVPSNDANDYNIPNIEDSPSGIQLWSDGLPGSTFFLVENRQKKYFDSGLPGAGVLVWWVNNPEELIDPNTVNSGDNHTMMPLEADGNQSLWLTTQRGDAGDPFPGTSNNTAFTFVGNPSSCGASHEYTGVSLWNIHTVTGAVYYADLTVKNGVLLETRTTAPDTLVLDGAAAQLDYLLLNNNTTITIEVLDAGSTVVKTLVTTQVQGRGSHSVTWDGKNTSGQNVTAGTYTFKISTSATNTTFGTTGSEVYSRNIAVTGGTPSSDASLSSLVPSAGSLTPSFASGTLDYTVSVLNSVSSITLTPTVNESHATVTVDGSSVASGSASQAISLTAGVPLEIPVVVTAQDGTTTRTYKVTVTRALPSSDAGLSSLVPSAGSLNPSFASGTLNYTVSVLNSVSSITLTPTVNESHATVTVDGSSVASGSASQAIGLTAGVPLEIPVVVTAQDGTTTRTYKVTVTRAVASSDASLKSLVASAGSFNPAFTPETLSYVLALPTTIRQFTLTPTVNESHARVKVDGVTVVSGRASGYILLTSGAPRTVLVEVTAQDGTVRTYTIIASRGEITVSSDARLRSLAPSAGSLTPSFASGTLNYTVSVANNISSIKLTPTVYNSYATVKVDGSSVASGTASQAISLTAGVPRAIPVVVTAQDGITTITYTVTVTRAAGALSSDASLRSLAPSAGSLNPAFASGTLSYTVSVANNVSSIRLTPTVNESHATVRVDGSSVASGTASQAISLTAGVPRAIPVVVTAQDGTVRTYTVTVTRAAGVLSNDASLKSLVASAGSFDPDFAPGTLNYDLTIPALVRGFTLTPTVNESHATIKIDGTSVPSGGSYDILVARGETRTLTIVVTAQDGVTKRTYNVTVYKETI